MTYQEKLNELLYEAAELLNKHFEKDKTILFEEDKYEVNKHDFESRINKCLNKEFYKLYASEVTEIIEAASYIQQINKLQHYN